MMQTEFVPKLVAAVACCCLLQSAMIVTSSLLTLDAVDASGYLDMQVAPLEMAYELGKVRVRANAYRINRFELALYERLVNVRLKRQEMLLEMYSLIQVIAHCVSTLSSQQLLYSLTFSSQRGAVAQLDDELCSWRKLIDPSAECNCTSLPGVPEVKFDGCELAPVLPQKFTRFANVVRSTCTVNS